MSATVSLRRRESINVRTYSVTLPLVGLIAGTRAFAGAGLALLLADKFLPDQRRAIGWTLLAVGILTTPPLAALVLSQRTDTPEALKHP